MDEYRNLIAGEAVRSSAGCFEVRGATKPWARLASLPRSGPADLREALARIEPGPVPSRCLRVLDDWQPSDELFDATAQCLGLERDEVQDLPGAWQRPSNPWPASDTEGLPRGIAVLAPGWNRFAAGFLSALARELRGGRAILMLPDARLPWVAAELAEELLAAGLPAERLALLHGVDADAWQEVSADPMVVAVHAPGERGRARALRQRLGERSADLPQLETWLEPDTTHARMVLPGADLEAAADATVVEAFGRVESLSGQAHGQLGRVFCAEQVYSRFTACVLERLQDGPECGTPLPQIDDAALERARVLEERGLDEGATLVHGGERLGAHSRERRLVPSVFVNVEARGALACHPDPAPCLALVRVPEGGEVDAGG